MTAQLFFVIEGHTSRRIMGHFLRILHSCHQMPMLHWRFIFLPSGIPALVSLQRVNKMEKICLIATASQSQASGAGWQMLAIYALLFLGMWFLLVAPQRKRQKNQQKMIDELKSGDKVVTTSGIVGTIANVKGSRFILKIADDTKIEIFRTYIQAKLDKSENTE
jgi:preprotein translocase subunit YajC